MIRYCCLSFAMLLLCVSSDSAFGQDQAKIPPEVIAGWRRLAEQSKTYRILFTHERRDGGKTSVPIIMSRLDDKYVKYENLRDGSSIELKDGEVRDFSPDIESVFLFDGSEYFSLFKASSSSKYTLAGVGMKNPMHLLRPHVSLGPEVSGYRLLDLADSPSNVQSFEKDETSCRLTYIEPRSNFQWKIVHVELDPSHDYRIISVVLEHPTYRVRDQFVYEVHPAIPTRIDASADKPNAPISGSHIRKFLPDQKVTRDQFQLEYYGLPPFRKRSQAYWPMIAAIVGGASVLVGGVYWWRRNRREN